MLIPTLDNKKRAAGQAYLRVIRGDLIADRVGITARQLYPIKRIVYAGYGNARTFIRKRHERKIFVAS